MFGEGGRESPGADPANHMDVALALCGVNTAWQCDGLVDLYGRGISVADRCPWEFSLFQKNERNRTSEPLFKAGLGRMAAAGEAGLRLCWEVRPACRPHPHPHPHPCPGSTRSMPIASSPSPACHRDPGWRPTCLAGKDSGATPSCCSGRTFWGVHICMYASAVGGHWSSAWG